MVDVTGGTRVGLAKFQTGDIATTESFLDTGLNGLPSLQQVTMLLHLRLRRWTSHIPLINYAVEGCSEELFVELVPKKNNMHVLCCGGLVSKALRFTLRMFTWQHIAVSLNLETRILQVIYDNLTYYVELTPPNIDAPPEQRVEVRAGGRLVLGQKLYSMEGDFIILNILDGEIADYRIYDVALQIAEMSQLLSCRDLPDLNPPLIDLQNNKLTVRGPTTIRTVEMNELCSDYVSDFYLFFSHKMNFKRAYSWCRKLKGQLIIPEDAKTNAFFFDKFVSYKDQCRDLWTHLFWIGAAGNLTTLQWLKLTDGTPITWYQFLREYGRATVEFHCIAAVYHDPYKWASCPCEIQTCILCNFTTYPVLRLRGLCRDSLLDRVFSFRDNEDFEMIFDGLGHVVMQNVNGSWTMRSRLYLNMRGTMLAQWSGEYPLGVHVWQIEGDRCLQKQMELLLTPCKDDEYTCSDLSCIAKSRRCDLSIDCEDQSDEMNCKVAMVPPGYSPGLLPPSLTSRPLPILFSLNITSIREFNLVSFTISMDIFLEMKWKDIRLKFSNLQEDFRSNRIKEMEEVWTPEIKAEDGTKSSVEFEPHSQAVYVIRVSGPLPDDDTTIREETVYSGTENMMVFKSENTLTFKCHFKLHMYPFDRQRCYIEYRIQDVSKDFVIFEKEGAGMLVLGERQLLEYTLISETITNYTIQGVSYVKVEFVFRNQYGYYISNTFLPSIMLVIICWLALYFDLTDFQDRIMVSLTSLLVLATFFTQTSNSIPKTTYLKLIDVWFVALISEDFIIIVSLVYIEVLRLKLPASSTLKVAPMDASSTKRHSLWVPAHTEAFKMNSLLLKIFFVATSILFLSFVSLFVISTSSL
nr:uncharacterized protein LOC128685465 [Cherax quadricarinatus]